MRRVDSGNTGAGGYPCIIQGGMGVAVSGWPLSRAVSLQGHLGVVSGTALDAVLVRRLQLGDQGGHLRRAFERFPRQDIAERVWQLYFIEGGKRSDKSFKSKPMPGLRLHKALQELVVLANFCEVFLAKEGHGGPVGINLLEKVQLMTLPSLFGAMLAGVDYVLMGAGIPRAIPGALDRLAALEPAELAVDVAGAEAGEIWTTCFDPRPFACAPLRRPEVPSDRLLFELGRYLGAKSYRPRGRIRGRRLDRWRP
jgi:nitronate monooxygenase